MASSVNSDMYILLKSTITDKIESLKSDISNYIEKENYELAKKKSIEILHLCRFLEYLNTRSLDMFFTETNRNIPKSLPG